MAENNLAGKKILVIEDESDMRKLLVGEIVRQGFLAIEAKNGEEGLITALKEKPDLILLDLLMPVMDGLTMLRRLREDGEWGKKVPVIILTNLSAESERVMSTVVRDEPAFYMVKVNWQPHDVVERIKERLSKAQ